MRIARPTTKDILLGSLCALLAVTELITLNEWSDGPRGATIVWVVLMAVAVAIRRVAIFASVALTLVGVTVVGLTGAAPEVVVLGLSAWLITFTVGVQLAGRELIAAVGMLIGASLIHDLADVVADWGQVVADVLFIFVWVSVGAAIRRRQLRIASVSELGAALTEDALREERVRIARELHDVVAHGLTAIVIQADSARTALPPGESVAIEALAAIEETGRASLREMRRLVGVLREVEPSENELSPQPGLADLPELFRSMRAAGLRVDYAVEGEPMPLEPGEDLAAYRIIQEALTNSLKHSGSVRAQVELEYASSGIRIEIVDSGRGEAATLASSGSGSGVFGMRERARIYGGSLSAEPVAEGFRVVAELPVGG